MIVLIGGISFLGILVAVVHILIQINMMEKKTENLIEFIQTYEQSD